MLLLNIPLEYRSIILKKFHEYKRFYRKIGNIVLKDGNTAQMSTKKGYKKVMNQEGKRAISKKALELTTREYNQYKQMIDLDYT